MNYIPLFQGGGAFLGAVIAFFYLLSTVPTTCRSQIDLEGIHYWCGGLGGPVTDVNMFPVLVGGIIGGIVASLIKRLTGEG